MFGQSVLRTKVRARLIAYTVAQFALDLHRGAHPKSEGDRLTTRSGDPHGVNDLSRMSELECMVRMLGMTVCDLVDMRQLSDGERGHVNFLREYFAHGGDWVRVVGCLGEQLEIDGLLGPRLESAWRRVDGELRPQMQSAIERQFRLFGGDHSE